MNVNNETINRILNKRDNSLHGYFLEVDLDYPEELHDKHSRFPMEPEKIKVKEEMLSLVQLDMKKKHDIKVASVNKLIPNLVSKKNYVVHYRNLKYYLSQGLILKKVHRIFELKQSDWMKPYIDFNTQKNPQKLLMKLMKTFLKY